LETEVDGLGGFRKIAAKWIERAAIRFVDLIVVVSPGIERWYRLGYPEARIVTVLNAPHLKAVERTSVLRERLGIPGHLRIALYQGGLSPARGIGRILGLASSFAKMNYAIIFMGYGSMQSDIETLAAANPNVYYHPAVPSGEVLHYTASADVGVHPIEGGSLNHDLCLPNKLFEYIAAEIPCVVSALPEMEAVVTKYGIGVCISEWTADSLVEALQKVDAMQGPDLALRLQAAAKEYCWEQQEVVMIDSYRTMMGKASIGVPAA
jgi:glycosyltransferase involved in cell wall biosynthesis